MLRIRYWDAELDPSQYSYVATAMTAGYSVLSYDRLSTGVLEKADAYTVVQATVELKILPQITLMVRNGNLLSFTRQ